MKRKKYVYLLTVFADDANSPAEFDVKPFSTEKGAQDCLHELIHKKDNGESIAEFVERLEWYVDIDEPNHYFAHTGCCEMSEYIKCDITKSEIQN